MSGAVRLLAFSFLASAAFAWPMPWLDRSGEALLGLAFAALALGDRVRPELRSLPRPIGSKRVRLDELDDDALDEELNRANPYVVEEEPVS